MSPRSTGIEDVRTRLSNVEGQLSTLSGEVHSIKTSLEFLSRDVIASSQGLIELNATINRWKGVAAIIMVAAPILGPLISLAIRIIFFGKPLSQ